MDLEPNTLKQTIILGVFFLLLVTTYISFSNIITFIFENNS
jgi:MFS family permease